MARSISPMPRSLSAGTRPALKKSNYKGLANAASLSKIDRRLPPWDHRLLAGPREAGVTGLRLRDRRDAVRDFTVVSEACFRWVRAAAKPPSLRPRPQVLAPGAWLGARMSSMSTSRKALSIDYCGLEKSGRCPRPRLTGRRRGWQTRSLIDPNLSRIAEFGANPLQRRRDILRFLKHSSTAGEKRSIV